MRKSDLSSDDLFSSPEKARSGSPLADRMRPQTLDDIAGQDHIVGPGRLLRRAIQADRLSSLIFYGPPGTGKTSLARVIANTTRASFESLNAVLAGIKDIREAIDRADERQRLYGKRTILFVDEVHRWNKAQQDALLPWVENGTVILVGATTENPFFEVNRALVSRSRIFQLKSLCADDLKTAALKAISDKERGYGRWNIIFEDGALEHLVEVASGDARSLLNALELAVETSPDLWPPADGAEIFVSFEAAEESIQRRAVLYDRDGDYHFDTISAFIKSIRGSDPDAALYWLAKMVRAGEDPSFIFRRMIISASEDVGLADPHALAVVISCAESFDRIGFPEGNFPLSHAALYLATAPKSNTTLAFFDALSEVDREDAEVPNHLRDGNRDKEGFGHGEGYVYPHAYRDHWAAQQYLPSSLKGKTFYSPSIMGYEGSIRDDVLQKRELQAAIVLGEANDDGEFLSWSAASKGREGWFKRLESGRSALLLSEREMLLGQYNLTRHDRVLIPNANDGLLLWECLRRCPEGLVAGLADSDQAVTALQTYASMLDEVEKPQFAVLPPTELPLPAQCESWFSTPQFDYIISREPWKKGFGESSALEVFKNYAERAKNLSNHVAILQTSPKMGEKISRIIREECAAPEKLVKALEEQEEAFFNVQASEKEKNRWTWEAADLEKAFTNAGFSAAITLIDQKEERLLSEKDTSLWFNKEKSRWGAFMSQHLNEEDFASIQQLLVNRANQGPITWKWKSILIKAEM
ncbi:MAG: AAA family ATPase [Treponema sp.]|jgi:putative ATPase|nr:AAA family ATPase [Treponema sp.]